MTEWEQIQNQFAALSFSNMTSLRRAVVNDKALTTLSSTETTVATSIVSTATKQKTNDVLTNKPTKTLLTSLNVTGGSPVNENDVLLVVPWRKLNALDINAHGTHTYTRLIYRNRFRFETISKAERKTNDDKQRMYLLQKLVQCIRERDGRFLKFDKNLNALVSIESDKTVMHHIEKDLTKAYVAHMNRDIKKRRARLEKLGDASKTPGPLKKYVRPKKTNQSSQKKTFAKKKKTSTYRRNRKATMMATKMDI